MFNEEVYLAGHLGFKGTKKFDTSKPNGISKKLLDVSKINSFDWKIKTSLRNSIKLTLKYFTTNTSFRK